MSRLYLATSYKGTDRWTQAESEATKLCSDLAKRGFKVSKHCKFPEKVIVVWEETRRF